MGGTCSIQQEHPPRRIHDWLSQPADQRIQECARVSLRTLCKSRAAGLATLHGLDGQEGDAGAGTQHIRNHTTNTLISNQTRSQGASDFPRSMDEEWGICS
ncbi:predicted protein [Histoplasma capsulatum H143]|uniref:Uncharacterized protein n=1 Tax=Ajellomyces capsulatus (strain H143) TaxID=544712 RepID=C6HND4_AJECH|nr:predicted protein [Histoplasma capsulatum H143]